MYSLLFLLLFIYLFIVKSWIKFYMSILVHKVKTKPQFMLVFGTMHTEHVFAFHCLLLHCFFYVIVLPPNSRLIVSRPEEAWSIKFY